MKHYRVVIDTNVFISALKSKRGASYRLMLSLGSNKFENYISVPLILEYEKIAKGLKEILLSKKDIEDVLDYICSVSKHQKIHYLWRPLLKDPNDDMVAELAVNADCDFIITYNQKDFAQLQNFKVKVIGPREFLERIGEIS